MKPILFNTAMVRAILDGKKTCTRRLIKNKYANADIRFWEHKGKKILVYSQNDVPEPKHNSDGTTTYKLGWMEEIEKPFKVGDILYVRETWNINPVWVFGGSSDNLPPKESKYIYKATNSKFTGGWKPSIHMPKEAARIFLKVTSVRAERLKDITDEGCYKEGISGTSFYDEAEHIQIAGIGLKDSLERASFSLLWNSTVTEEKYFWEYNPWVWVIEFERIEKGE